MKSARSLTAYRLPRMLVMPRNQRRAPGTLTIGGTGMTSSVSERLTSQLTSPARNPRREPAVSRLAAACSCCESAVWNSRRLNFLAMPRRRSAERLDLRQQVFRLDRLHEIGLRPLPHAPDLVGFLALGGAHDDRNVLGGIFLGDHAGRLVT